jgi:nucleotidyltransferase substrate binding protein (TIGR01987 family)
MHETQVICLQTSRRQVGDSFEPVCTEALEMTLSLDNLGKAVAALGLSVAQPKNDFIRDSVIQRFEFTYELAWKAIRKQLVEEIGEASADGLSRKDLFRKALQQKIISDFDAWVSFHEARNSTSHNYNEANAEKVYQVALQFLPEAQRLLLLLKKRGWLDATESKPS